MSDVVPLDKIEITEIEEHPATESVLLHGPPGTGKTTMAAARVALLLRDHPYELHDVTWATYRRSLAEDTLERLAGWGIIDEGELENPATEATKYINTIHAVANRVAGGLPQPVESWHKQLFCNHLDIPYSTTEPWETSAGKELFDCFEWMAENCYDPSEPADLQYYPNLDTLRDHFRGDVADVWKAWNRYKDEEDRIDYHEQLQTALVEGASPETDILVIDEYHDATPLIARVAEMWMADAEIIIVAGDPHQVINQYQGASPYFFGRLEERYAKILLDKSYRVGEQHWRAATTLLAKAHDPPQVEPTGSGWIHEYQSGKFWYSSDTGWQTPPATQLGSPTDLATQYSDDIMFLTRTKMQADGIGAALEKAGVLYTSQKTLGGWNTDRGETRLALYNTLTKIRGVSPDDFDEGGTIGLGRFEEGSRSPEDIYLSSAETVELLRHTNAKYLVQSRRETKEYCDQISEHEEPQALTDIDGYVTRDFWGTYTHGAGSERHLNKRRRHDRERFALRKALQKHNEPIDPTEIPVSVMTVHASKGQEADDVVVYDGIVNKISQGMRLDDETWKNEWRTWYVALTRAAERLHIMRGGFNWTDSIIPNNICTIAAGGTVRREREVGDD